VKIAQVLTASTGGIGRHVASVASRLVQRGHAVRIYGPVQSVRAHHLDDLGAEVLPLTRLSRLTGADAVHAHGYKAGAVALAPCRVRRMPLVVTWHNAVLATGATAMAAHVLQRLVARGADLTLGASGDLVRQARGLGAAEVRLSPVAAPVLGPPEVPRDVQRRKLGLTDDDVMILTVSRLAPQKNLGLVLDIARSVRERPELMFLIAGDGPLRGTLAERARTEGSNVRLLGHQDQMASLLAAADLALLTSTWEARALVAQEALLAGVPLLTTRIEGIEELVDDAAAFFDADDLDEAVRKLLELAHDRDRRAALRAAGSARAATWPGEDAVVDDLLSHYREVARR
jgi:glycosyltransferase involved in cell wall biosynthesis